MTTDQIRAEFEKAFPLPTGISWDGDHFQADRTVIGSHSNATIWGHMWRGWRKSREILVIPLIPGHSYARTAGEAHGFWHEAMNAAGIRTC